MQSPEWAAFRAKTGITIVPLGQNLFMTIHRIPKTPYTIGYIPKSRIPTNGEFKKIIDKAKEKKCIFVKLEPNVIKNSDSEFRIPNSEFRILTSSHPLFTHYTFQLDITQPEAQLLENMKSKTRYNIRVSQKHGVFVKEETGKEAFETYLDLAEQTWKRQHFYGHDKHYHRLMWETLHPAGIAHLLIAYYPHPAFPRPKPLTAWIVFLYKNVLYYPYGASSSQYKHVMASNLMMWEAICFGKKNEAAVFDMWGSLGPNPDPKDPWYGFHRFKESFGPKLVEFIGSYDLVIDPTLYTLYSIIHPIRQLILRLA